MPHITNFPPGVTHVPCLFCNRLVDVRPESEEWNENPSRPAHRLCQNQRPEPWWATPPLNVDQLKGLWRMIVLSETGKRAPFNDETKRQIIEVIRATLNENHYHSGCRINFANEVRRSQVLAARLIWLIDTGNWGLPLAYRHGMSIKRHVPDHVRRPQQRDAGDPQDAG